MAGLASLAGCSGPTDGDVFVGATYGALHPADERWLRGAPDDGTAAALVTRRPERSPLTDAAPAEFREVVRTASYGRQCAVVLAATFPRDRASQLVVPSGGVAVVDRRLRVETRAEPLNDDPPDADRVAFTGIVLVNLEGTPTPRRLAVAFPQGTVTATGRS